VEHSLQQSKQIARSVEIGVLEEDYSFEWASLFPIFTTLKKKEHQQ
jgi:hypothetical protein